MGSELDAAIGRIQRLLEEGRRDRYGFEDDPKSYDLIQDAAVLLNHIQVLDAQIERIYSVMRSLPLSVQDDITDALAGE